MLSSTSSAGPSRGPAGSGPKAALVRAEDELPDRGAQAVGAHDEVEPLRGDRAVAVEGHVHTGLVLLDLRGSGREADLHVAGERVERGGLDVAAQHHAVFAGEVAESQAGFAVAGPVDDVGPAGTHGSVGDGVVEAESPRGGLSGAEEGDEVAARSAARRSLRDHRFPADPAQADRGGETADAETDDETALTTVGGHGAPPGGGRRERAGVLRPATEPVWWGRGAPRTAVKRRSWWRPRWA